METAVYNFLKVTLGKREALALYYRLTGFIRKHDTNGFSRFMEFRDGTQNDYALMCFVLNIMVSRHQIALEHLLSATEIEAAA